MGHCIWPLNAPEVSYMHTQQGLRCNLNLPAITIDIALCYYCMRFPLVLQRRSIGFFAGQCWTRPKAKQIISDLLLIIIIIIISTFNCLYMYLNLSLYTNTCLWKCCSEGGGGDSNSRCIVAVALYLYFSACFRTKQQLAWVTAASNLQSLI